MLIVFSAKCVKEIRERVEAERQALDNMQAELAVATVGADVSDVVTQEEVTNNEE